MNKYLLFLIIALTATTTLQAQQILPDISVKNISGKIIVSWRNEYNLPVATISIQRSYDSLKNYTTIGSVLNPLNKENGYADANPPYNKMYYRVFIAFEGGSYIISKTVRPVKETSATTDSTKIQRYPWQVNPLADSSLQSPPINVGITKPLITYPSKRIFTSRDNSVVIHLPEAATKKYTIKFFDELDNLVFELTKLNEEYLIIEKVNFGHSGWYHFELYEAGTLVEKNKFFVPKDSKTNNR
ncbi:MAG: hypothetical protein ABJA37_06940 [Ferruginibacter sp.]